MQSTPPNNHMRLMLAVSFAFAPLLSSLTIPGTFRFKISQADGVAVNETVTTNDEFCDKVSRDDSAIDFVRLKSMKW